MNTSGNVSMTGHINIQGNWTGTQGTLVVGTSNENFFGTSASISGPAAAFDNLNIQSGAGVSFPASTEVLVGVNLANSGTISFPSTSTLGLNGTASQAITGSSMTIPSIHAHSGSRTITLSTAIVLLDVLQVDANVTFACGNNLTLHSTNALSARVGPKGAGASITGNVTVRTVIPGGATGWANLGVPGVQSQAISSWDTYSSSGGTTGVPMTCDGCAFGIDALGPDFYSIQGWDEDNDTYDTTITASTLLTPGQGFWVYVGNGASSSTDLMFVNTGALVQGPVSAAVTALGNGDISNGNQVYYNLVANPYPSPIDWDLVFNNNNVFFQAPIYAWSADIGPTSYVSGVSDGGITNLIPAGQGFYVEYNQLGGTNFSLDFNESDKLTFSGNFPLVKPGAAATNSVGQTFRLKLQGSADKSETVFRVHGSATPYFDKALDAHKMFVSPGYVGYPNFYSQYTSLSSKDAAGEDYSIQSLPPLTQGVTIPLVARVSTSGTYTLSAYDFKDFASCVAVVDKVDNSYHDLRLSNYVFSISDTTFASRFDLVLCRDESVNPTGISEAQAGSNSIFINQDQQGAYVKTAFAQNTKATISVYNVIGQKLMNDISVEGMATNTRLNLDLHNQVVLIRVVTDKESSTKRIVMH